MKKAIITISTLFLLMILNGCSVTGTSDDLDKYVLASMPSYEGMQKLLAYDDTIPFVGVNALVFKEYATGNKYEGLTGLEAYLIYGESGLNTLDDVGGRGLWSGFVHNQILGDSNPTFDSFGVYAYQSSNNFIEYLTDPNEEEDLEARSAGLLGQWHIPSSTISESTDKPGPVSPESLPSMDQIIQLTGLSEEQVLRILESPENEPVTIIEFLRFSDDTGKVYEPYLEATYRVLKNYGAVQVWRGKLEFFFIGNSRPMFHQMVITTFPSPKEYLLMLIDPEIVSQSSLKDSGLSTHWLFTAYFFSITDSKTLSP